MLTEKDRLFYAMRKEPVDRPPWICPGGMMNLATRDMMDAVDAEWPEAHTSPEKMATLAAAAYDTGCFENYGLPFCMTVEVEGMGAAVDLGSRMHEPHVTKYAIQSVDQWEMLPSLDCAAGRAATVLTAIRLLRAKNTDVPVIGNLTGPVSTASSLMEPTTFYKELRKKRETAHRYMEFICTQLIRFGLKQLEAGVDVIAISDPSGTGEILGPKRFEEFVVPYINKIINALRSAFPACEVIVHICGQMRSVYTQMERVECGTLSFDALVSLKEARQSLPEKVLMGNISTYILEFAQPDKIRDVTRLCLSSGPNILSPACGLGSGCPAANLQAVLETLKETGQKHEI